MDRTIFAEQQVGECRGHAVRPSWMSHVGGLDAWRCRSAVDDQRPCHTAPRGKRCEEGVRDYNGGASYQF
jgi:hypothetical protein